MIFCGKTYLTILFIFFLLNSTTVEANDACNAFSMVSKLDRTLQKKKYEKKVSNSKLTKDKIILGRVKSPELIYQYGRVYLNSRFNHGVNLTRIPIKNGDVIRTGTQSFAVIKTINGSQIKVFSNSQIYFKSISRMPIQIELKKGRVDNSVSSSFTQNKSIKPNDYKFLLTTPSLNLGVRGTQFKVEHNINDSKVSVKDGVVDIQPTNVCERVSQLKTNEGATVTRMGVHKIKLLDSPNLKDVPVLFKRAPVFIKFGGVLGAHNYRVQVSHDSDFVYLIKEQIIEEPEFHFEDLDNGYYYIRVSAIDMNGLETIPAQIRILVQLD